MSNLSPFPGTGFDDFNTDNWLKKAADWLTGNDNVVTSSNKLIKFYIDRQDWLHPNSNIINNVEGWLQNGWYNLLHSLASGVEYLIKAALFPVYELPKMLIEDGNSTLHILYFAAVAISFSLMGIYAIVSMFGFMGSGQNDELKRKLKNIFGNMSLVLILPLIFYAGGQFMNNLVGSGSSNIGLADTPLKTNTLDMEKWALDEFSTEPFSDGNSSYNQLGKNQVPDFSNSIDKDDVTALNKAGAKKSGKKTDDVGSVFNYKLDTITNTSGTSENYKLNKLSLKSGFLHALDESYKRYRVQNIPATGAFLIIIIVGGLMSVKIMRASIGMFGKVVVAPVVAGRDAANSVEGVKGTINDLINGWLGIFMDLFMLQIFSSLVGTLPQKVAGSVDGAGGFIRGIIYLLVMGILAFACFDGSSAIEKQFGMSGGGKGQGGFLGRMSAPGVALGALAGSGATKIAEKYRLRQEQGRAAAEEKDDPSRKNPGFSDSEEGKRKAQQLINGDSQDKSNPNDSDDRPDSPKNPENSENPDGRGASDNSGDLKDSQKSNDFGRRGKDAKDRMMKMDDKKSSDGPESRDHNNSSDEPGDSKNLEKPNDSDERGNEAKNKMMEFDNSSQEQGTENKGKSNYQQSPSVQERMNRLEQSNRTRLHQERMQNVKQDAEQKQAKHRMRRQRALQRLRQQQEDPHKSVKQNRR
ncbi:hypothetical protein FFRU_120550 [Fructobacillus fructosus]|uniref:hypothetical protein n=1 Tax=Fructobacillus fructosus TaxID=1631 RepID=UPI0002195915|nr:hypothetical protein [Fructobacillus fructosus]KRN51382.1 hypothetical protein IV71_GL000751 [Fructobacillus fructosus KCTC 3544]GAP01793.1 hypothetical protein FFRU_120550 [Fructobacillus fructosus]